MHQISDVLTVKLRQAIRGITTSVGISRPFEIDSIGQPPRPHRTSALWDTGSTHCLITKSLAENLDLNPISKIQVAHHEGMSFANVYLMAIYITKRYYVVVELTETKAPSDNFEIIIGMDVITKGDMAITTEQNETIFSFRLPSSTTIDFTKKT
ncbi:hypothetical protein JYT74_03060 [Crocinitomix catalasitica]|nr:hypothetical protein [Crocinitomix catalasitica]